MLLKQYAFKRKKAEERIPPFYGKLIISAIIFGMVTVLCNINKELKEPVKKILYHSYEFENIKDDIVIYSNKCKEFFYNIKNAVIQGE